MDLLDLSHIEQQTEIETAFMNLSELAYTTIDNLQNQARYKDIKIVSEIEKDVIIEAHENKLHKSLLIYYQMQLIIHLRIMRLL